MTETTRHPASTCRRCGKAFDAATGINDASRPGEGDVSFCAYCGTVSIYESCGNDHHRGELHLRPPTETEIDELLADDRFVVISTRMMDHFGVSVDNGVAMRCGCRIDWRAELFTVVACAPDCLVAHRVLKMVADSGKPYSVIR